MSQMVRERVPPPTPTHTHPHPHPHPHTPTPTHPPTHTHTHTSAQERERERDRERERERRTLLIVIFLERKVDVVPRLAHRCQDIRGLLAHEHRVCNEQSVHLATGSLQPVKADGQVESRVGPKLVMALGVERKRSVLELNANAKTNVFRQVRHKFRVLLCHYLHHLDVHTRDGLAGPHLSERGFVQLEKELVVLLLLGRGFDDERARDVAAVFHVPICLFVCLFFGQLGDDVRLVRVVF
jgi:hypothetical protein